MWCDNIQRLKFSPHSLPLLKLRNPLGHLVCVLVGPPQVRALDIERS